MRSAVATELGLPSAVASSRGHLLRLVVGVNLMWLSLSMLFDGLNTLVLPSYLADIDGPFGRATVLGLATFAGLTLGMLVQPLAGMLSDRLRARWGRRGVLAAGTLLLIAALSGFLFTQLIPAIILIYLAVQITASAAQAALQGFIPDLIPRAWRGRAAGVKSFMDIGGAMLGFLLLGELLGEGQTNLAIITLIGALLATYLLTLLLVHEPSTSQSTHETGRLRLAQVFQLDFRQHSDFVKLIVSRFLFLLGTYVVGRFLLFFVSDRLALTPGEAVEQAGMLLAGLALLTVLATLPSGWLADRLGRIPLMLTGAVLSAVGVLLLVIARSPAQMLLFGGLMSLGSGAFASANWALTADVVPADEAARFMALANFGTAGATAAAGLFGILFDAAEASFAGSGYSILFSLSAASFVASALVVRGMPARKDVVSGASY